MIIRHEQMQRMQDARVCEYVETLARHLETDFATQVAARGLTGTTLRRVVRNAINDAHEYGVEGASDVQLYVECIAILGPHFDRNPENIWLGEMLRRPDLTGSAKMDAINEGLLFGQGGPR